MLYNALLLAASAGQTATTSAVEQVPKANTAFVGRTYCIVDGNGAALGPRAIVGLPSSDKTVRGLVAVVDLRTGAVDRLIKGPDEPSFGRHVVMSRHCSPSRLQVVLIEVERSAKESEGARPELMLWSDQFAPSDRSVVGLSDERELGVWLCDIGDVDKDGNQDIVLGAKLAGGYRCICVSGATLQRIKAIDLVGGNRPIYDSVICQLVGDINADGVNDLALQAGARVIVRSGSDLGEIVSLENPDARSDGFGVSMAQVADIDDDGVADLAIGCPQLGSRPAKPGTIRIYSGKSGGQLRELPGNAATRGFGYALQSGPDLDGDGVDDLIASSYFVAVDAVTAMTVTGKELWSAAGSMGEAPDIGRRISIVSDLNGDGVPDVVVSRSTLTELYLQTAGLVWYSGKDGSRLGRFESAQMGVKR